MTQFLLIICGIPASGKTSLAEALRSALEKSNKVRIVSTDVWRDEEYYLDFKPENEKAVRKKALEHTSLHIAEGFSVISDDTNYYQSMRHELYDLARQAECTFGVVFVNTPLDTAIRWNQMRESSVPEEVVRRIDDRLDIPGSKYAWRN
ncbi:MAG: AAA family ATPase [Candidatus Thorarchaeota archaeon]|jgi:O-phosphoseryl-tRNA(Sec) kinase